MGSGDTLLLFCWQIIVESAGMRVLTEENIGKQKSGSRCGGAIPRIGSEPKPDLSKLPLKLSRNTR